MQNMTDMTVIDPPSTFAYSAYYVKHYLTCYAYGFQGFILFYIYMANSPRGSPKTLDRSSAYPPRATLSGLRGSWMLSWKITWYPAMAAKDSFEPFAVFSGNVNSTADGPRHGAIPSIWPATAFGGRIARSCLMCYYEMISYMISLLFDGIVYDIIDIILWAGLRGGNCALPQQPEPGAILQCQDRFWLSGGRSGVVCTPSTLF
jgi:hypothetical protein